MTPIPADSPLRQRPRLAEVPTGGLKQAELLGTPEVPTLLGYTRRVLHLRDGHTLAAFSFSSSAPANWMFLIDGRDLSVTRHDIPHNDIASHSAALGADGDIYIMPYSMGRAYRFRAGAGAFEEIEGEKLPDREFTWEAYGASGGGIYFGTYPNAYFGEYRPDTWAWTLWRQVAENTKYVTNFSEDGEGRVRFRAWGPDEVWMVFDPRTRGLSRVEAPDPVPRSPERIPDPPEGDTSLRNRITVGGRRFAVGFPTGRLWEIGPDGALWLRGDPQCPAEVWFLEAVKDALVGISHFGALFRYDLGTGAFQCGRLPNRAAGGNPIMFIETVTPRCVVGANYSQQNLFKIDPETGGVEGSDGMIARVTGEPMCAVGLGGKAYVGIYVQSVLSVYDPDRPFAFGENPRELIELGARYAQTRPRDAVTDGQRVFISSDSAYSHLGGALVVIDPGTERIDVYHHLIRDQNLPTLAYDPSTQLLWGGTDRWGQMRSHPPTQESALIYAFDPASRAVVETLTPWPGADVTSVLGVSSDGILVAASGQEVALIQTATREILYQGTWPLGPPRKLRRGGDGFCYVLSDGVLHRWDLAQNVLTPVAGSPGCIFLTEPSPGTWLLANRTSVYRFRNVSVLG